MARLPTPGHDAGQWGDILNEYLSQAHKTDGTLKDNVVGSSQLQDGVIASAKLSAALQDSVTKADTAVQPGDLGTSASRNIGTGPGTVAAGDDTRITTALTADGVDDVVAAQVTDPASATRAALSSTYATRPRMGRGVLIGDSTDFGTAGSGSGKWIDYLTAVSGGRVRLMANRGVSGDTTTLMLARFDTDVIALHPDFVIIGGPTNDHSQGIPEATTRSNLAAMINKARAAGIPVIMRNCWPSDTTGSSPPWNTIALRRAVIQRHNAWLTLYAAGQGIPVLDVYTPTVDPATGGLKAGFGGDGTHPSGSAYLAAAQHIVSQGLPPVFSSLPPLPAAANDSAWLPLGTANGIYTVDTNGDGTADGVTRSDTAVATSLITGDTAILGTWQRNQGTAAVANPSLDVRSNTFVVGHRYAIVTRFKTSAGGFRLRAAAWGGSGTGDFGNFSEACEGVAYQEIVATGAISSLRAIAMSMAPIGGTVDFQLAQTGIIDLTALGY